jgi:hypothetical protein
MNFYQEYHVINFVNFIFSSCNLNFVYYELSIIFYPSSNVVFHEIAAYCLFLYAFLIDASFSFGKRVLLWIKVFGLFEKLH